MQNHASTLAAEFAGRRARSATVALIDEGNTIPFIARYRKATGSMDDQSAARAGRTAFLSASWTTRRRPCTIPLPSRAR
ncbi:MAG: Tex-like N-terminal domain-containing protein [Ruthenibacterium lactatiformans]